MYINYPHVGKHFGEIVFSGDINVKKEQYHPQSIARTGFNVWLGPEVDGSTFKNKAKKVHKALKDRLELPEWNDPSLRLGYIPFAKLKTDINSSDLIQHLLKLSLTREVGCGLHLNILVGGEYSLGCLSLCTFTYYGIQQCGSWIYQILR